MVNLISITIIISVLIIVFNLFIEVKDMKVVLENLTKVFPSRNKKSGGEVTAVNNFNFEILACNPTI